MRLLPVFLSLAAISVAGPALAQSIARPTARLTPEEKRQGYSNRAVLAKPRATTQAAALAVAEAGEGRRIRRTFANLENLRVIEVTGGETVKDAIARLQATGRYEFVEPDYLRTPDAVLPNDPRFTAGDQWYLRNTGQNGGTAGADVGAVAAWEIRPKAPGVIVAIIDTGLHPTHEDLAANLWTNAREIPNNGIDDDADGYIDDVHGINSLAAVGSLDSGNPVDDHGHGTLVAGLVGAVGNNGCGLSSLAWQVQIMPLKFDDAEASGTMSDEVECIDYALAHGANLINLSYGSPLYSQAEFDAIRRARDAGVIFVTSGGNNGTDNDLIGHYPSNYLLDNIVAVAASDRNDAPSVFSNYGVGVVELSAPGTGILSTSRAADDAYETHDGTSFSAPLVASALALVRAQFPADTYRGTINRLLRSVDRLPAFTGRSQTSGRLNVGRALATTTDRPFNDNFADRPLLTSFSVVVRGSSTLATSETGEPAHASLPADGTLWWSWTAPSSGNVAVDTSGSTFDTVVAVYTGSSLDTLVAIASNDNATDVLSSRVLFKAVAGTTYQLAVGGKQGGRGSVVLNLGFTPPNDDFTAALPLTGRSLRSPGFNVAATFESGEPNPGTGTRGRSVWFKWTAPSSEYYSFSVFAYGFDAVGAVYTGTSLSTLALLATTSTKLYNEPADFEAVSGTTYYFQIDSVNDAVGYFNLTISDDVTLPFYYAVDPSPAFNPDTGYLIAADISGGLLSMNIEKSDYHASIIGGYLNVQIPAFGADGLAYLGDNYGSLYALESSLAVRWQKSLGPVAITSSAGIGADGAIYVHTDDGFLHGFFPDGSLKWRAIVPGQSYSSPTIGGNGTIYIGSEDEHLYALSPLDGSVLWKFRTDGAVYTSPAIDAEGSLYFGTLNGKFYALSATGRKLWEYNTDAPISSSAALATDGTLYFGCYDKNLYALSSTGSLRWKYPTGDEIRASSPALASDGTIYIGSYDGCLHAVTPEGTNRRIFATGAYIRSSPLIADGLLSYGGGDALIHLAYIGANLADSPWPMHRQNPRRTGRRLSTRAPEILTPPSTRTVTAGSRTTLAVNANGGEPLSFQWYLDGAPISGATHSTYTIASAAAGSAGNYTVAVTSPKGTVTSAAAAVTVAARDKVTGSGREVGSNLFVASNGNTFDQVLLEGSTATITADHELNQITRLSYVDLDEDIVQVEMSGPGSLTITLENSSGPALAGNYNQSTLYIKGHASIAISGADERTNLSIFSVGRKTAVNQALFKDDVTYGGIADLANITIASPSGRFGGIRTANARYSGSHGVVGIVAPGIAFDGPVFLGDLKASGEGVPSLLLGRVADTRVTGGNLLQDNGRAVQVSGLSKLKFTAGGDSHGKSLPAQANRAVLEDEGRDVTSGIVVNPSS